MTEQEEQDLADAALVISTALTSVIRIVHGKQQLSEPGTLNLAVIVAGVAESLGDLMHPLAADDVETVLDQLAEELRDFHRLHQEACPCHQPGAGCTRH
ncbi:MAG: hypothetical protein ACRC67_33215 [Inquilinus sp.]|uniref:hypothetical protein n=1 Tax=Inquilinus sp. TaxID=1932117 RepID=UPI003F2BF8C7